MSSTPACEVCGAPALARVGGVPFCAPCALTIDPDRPIPRRSSFRRLARPIAALSVVALLVVSGVALAAFWPSAPTVPGGDAVGSNGFMAAADHDESPYPEGEPSDLSAAARDYGPKSPRGPIAYRLAPTVAWSLPSSWSAVLPYARILSIPPTSAP